MTRIIAGDARGAALAVPRSGTRPTSDRVREAMFSTLGSMGVLEGVEALDLYAGTGALGLEAVSRGAASATFVERAPKAAALLRRNAAAVEEAIRRSGSGRRVRLRVEQGSALAGAEQAAAGLGLVFIDPPYELPGAEIAQVLAALAPKLEPWGIIVLERSARDPLPELPAGIALEQTRIYGETALHYLERSREAAGGDAVAQAPDEAR